MCPSNDHSNAHLYGVGLPDEIAKAFIEALLGEDGNDRALVMDNDMEGLQWV